MTLSVAFPTDAASVAQDCGTQMACYPWNTNGPACQRSKLLSLRYTFNTAVENAYTFNKAEITNATYAFCATVDQLQSFSLNGAPYLASAYSVTDSTGAISYALTRSLNRSYLSVFGFGESNNTLYPTPGLSTGTALIAVNGSTTCGEYRSAALVSILVLNVGLHNGLFNYIDASEGSNKTVANPNYDAAKCAASATGSSSGTNYCNSEITETVAAVVVQPAKTGFVPTCDANDKCSFGSDYVCIGDEVGKKNCGTCYNDASQIVNASLTVWVSYYGTDVKGHTLTSGGLNPFNFLKFATSDALSTIVAKMKDLFKGNITDLGL